MKAVNAFACDEDGHGLETPTHPHDAGQSPRSPLPLSGGAGPHCRLPELMAVRALHKTSTSHEVGEVFRFKRQKISLMCP